MCRPAILTQPTANQPPAGLKPAGGLVREHQFSGCACDRKQSRDAACCVSTGVHVTGRLMASIALPGSNKQFRTSVTERG